MSSGNMGGGTMGDGTGTASIDAYSSERIQNFEEAFMKIKSATGITDIGRF